MGKTRLRNIIIFSYIAIILAMTLATIADKAVSPGFAEAHVYSSWWFAAIWAILAASAAAYMARAKMARRPALLVLHASLLLILTGALVTRLTAVRGIVHVRQGESTTVFLAEGGGTKSLPFSITLNKFETVDYPGTDTPMDYVSHVTLTDTATATTPEEATISMNNIASRHGYRLYQTSYDSDGRGTILSVSHDPAGIGMTYAGYALLFVSLLLVLVLPGEAFRRSLRALRQISDSSEGKAALIALLIALAPQKAEAGRLEAEPDVACAMPAQAAEAYGDLMCYYGGRVCPLQTVARDFTAKIYGRNSYMGLTAEQVLMGWTLDAPRWTKVRMIRIKRDAAAALGIGETLASYAELAQSPIGREAAKARGTGRKSVARSLDEAEEKVAIVRMLFAGEMLKVFPLPDCAGRMAWYSPADEPPAGTGEATRAFVRGVFSQAIAAIGARDTARMADVARKIAEFQRIATDNAGGARAGVIPPAGRLRAEKACNELGVTRPLAMALTAIGIVFFFIVTFLWGRGITSRAMRMFTGSLAAFLGIVGAYLLAMFCLRWYAGGHLPLGNGPETMHFMSLCVIALALLATRSFALALPFGYLMSGLCLMVSMFGESNPQVTSLMPVLGSPLLSVHVCLVMISYTLLAFMFLNGLSAIVIARMPGDAVAKGERVDTLAAISRTLLTPAVAFLAAGIFVGAIWANQSWGRYWGWDPKEVWALITMMVYAIPLHTSVAKGLARPLALHIFLVAAFATVIMTYFGVNYLLGGMHSYA